MLSNFPSLRDQNHALSKRWTDPELNCYELNFYFQAVEVDDVLASNQTQKEQVIHIDHESFYEGRVFGELQSRATVHLEDGLLTAKIETPQDIYHIGKGMNTHLRPFIFTFLVLFPKAKLLKQIGHFLIVNSKISCHLEKKSCKENFSRTF